ncbi:hypothetical protein TNCV_3767861 [Trichonephila clavipes]|nr:hypothetical protein TNCV_3767861 [Trichonephila clavipes]
MYLLQKTFLLLVVVLPCIVIADVRCPGGKICSSRQKCCKVNAENAPPGTAKALVALKMDAAGTKTLNVAPRRNVARL